MHFVALSGVWVPLLPICSITTHVALTPPPAQALHAAVSIAVKFGGSFPQMCRGFQPLCKAHHLRRPCEVQQRSGNSRTGGVSEIAH